MNQKGFANIAIIVLVIVLAGVAGYFTLNKQAKITAEPQPTTSQVPTVSTDQITNFKTYRNDKYGFEVSYPSDYKTYSVNTEGVLHPDSILFSLISIPSRGPTGAHILIPLPLNDELAHSNPNAQSLDDYKKNYTTNDGRNVVIDDQKEMLVNGIKALRQVYSDANPIGDFNNAYHNLRYVFFNEKQFIIIDGGVGGGVYSASNDKVLDQVASTFKFNK